MEYMEIFINVFMLLVIILMIIWAYIEKSLSITLIALIMCVIFVIVRL